jgi:hypothetical protein
MCRVNENVVLRGAAKLLGRCMGVQIELALTRSYAGQDLIGDTIQNMYDAAFRLVFILEGFRDRRTGYLFEVDGIFVRADVACDSGQGTSPTLCLVKPVGA